MFSSGPAGFYQAPVTQGIVLAVGASSIAAGFLQSRDVGLNVAGLFGRGEVWRLATHNFVFNNNTEIMFGGMLLYVSRMFERRYGSLKFASFAVLTSTMSTIMQVAILFLLRKSGFDVVSSGPYGFIYAMMVQYFYSIPRSNKLNIGGFDISSKTFTYLLALQLAYSGYPHSVIPVIS
eukprot:Colp12_sorted_trinity150504_noHs@26674